MYVFCHQRSRLLQVLNCLFVGLFYSRTIRQHSVYWVVRCTVNDRHTEVCIRVLRVWSTVCTTEIEVNHATQIVAFSQLCIGNRTLTFRNILDDIRCLRNHFIAIIPEVLQSVVIRSARIRDKLIESIGRRTTNHDVISCIFATAIHRVRPRF